MATITQQRVRARPAHPFGPTCLAYTPNGKNLITAGANSVVRVYTTGSYGEPTNIDDCQENNLAIVAANDFFVTGSEDGRVCAYSLETFLFDKMLTRCTLPIRDLALSPDRNWLAVASDEVEVKIVDLREMTRVLYLREHPKPAKHITFHPSGSYIAVSCTDGIIYNYSLSTEEPEMLRKVDGVIRSLETDAEISSRAIWHPDGRAFAAPTATRDIQVVSRADGERQRALSGGHSGDITSLAWSPNGALLLSSASDKRILLWETKTQKVLARYEYSNVINLAWHPYDNIVSFTTSDGELFICEDFVSAGDSQLLEKPLQPAPFIHDPLAEGQNGLKDTAVLRGKRRGTPDSLDDILGPDLGVDEDDFVSDDDGAGYLDSALNGHGKRSNAHLDPIDGNSSKRTAQSWAPRIHEPFQPGSTPWRGNRRYLCLNLIGFVWTVDQDTHHTVTVEFYDREMYRDFHFTDPYLYDKACLSNNHWIDDSSHSLITVDENGTLFSCPRTKESSATIFYRPHETWTTRADWRTQLPEGEDVTAISLSDSYVVVTTSANYVRVYTLYGTPFKIYRQKSSPTVTCASWRDYVLTMGNGPVGGDGMTKLCYTIENVKRDEVCQCEDVVALPLDAKVNTVFFSDTGDPCIYDSTGVLLILEHWRTPGQSRWVPLLDTKLLDRLQDGRKQETYWPVAVAQGKFHCIILKGGDQYPYFPKPLLSEFDFKIPCSSSLRRDEDTDGVLVTNDRPKLEESYLRSSLMLNLLEDLLSVTNATIDQRSEFSQREVEVDKALLQLLNIECQEGEERGMKALEIVTLMKDRNGKMIEAAGRVAGRYGRTVLQQKISELAERKLMAMDEDEDVVS